MNVQEAPRYNIKQYIIFSLNKNIPNAPCGARCAALHTHIGYIFIKQIPSLF